MAGIVLTPFSFTTVYISHSTPPVETPGSHISIGAPHGIHHPCHFSKPLLYTPFGAFDGQRIKRVFVRRVRKRRALVRPASQQRGWRGWRQRFKERVKLLLKGELRRRKVTSHGQKRGLREAWREIKEGRRRGWRGGWKRLPQAGEDEADWVLAEEELVEEVELGELERVRTWGSGVDIDSAEQAVASGVEDGWAPGGRLRRKGGTGGVEDGGLRAVAESGGILKIEKPVVEKRRKAKGKGELLGGRRVMFAVEEEVAEEVVVVR